MRNTNNVSQTFSVVLCCIMMYFAGVATGKIGSKQTLKKRRKRREKKVEKAGLDLAAVVPSQPDRPDGSYSDRLAGSKESAW